MAPKVSVVKVKKNVPKAAKPYKSQAAKEAEKTTKRLKTKKADKVKIAKTARDRIAKGTTYRLKKMESQGVRALPETPESKRGMSLKRLIQWTPRLFINNAVFVRHHRIKKLRTATGKPVVRGIMYTDDPYRPNKVRRYHETYFVGIGPNQDAPIHKQSKVLVQCSCENFVYVFEYANATMGASRLLFCNGEPPVFTNPGLAPGLCKHGIALAKIIIERGL